MSRTAERCWAFERYKPILSRPCGSLHSSSKEIPSQFLLLFLTFKSHFRDRWVPLPWLLPPKNRLTGLFLVLSSWVIGFVGLHMLQETSNLFLSTMDHSLRLSSLLVCTPPILNSVESDPSMSIYAPIVDSSLTQNSGFQSLRHLFTLRLPLEKFGILNATLMLV